MRVCQGMSKGMSSKSWKFHLFLLLQWHGLRCCANTEILSLSERSNRISIWARWGSAKSMSLMSVIFSRTSLDSSRLWGLTQTPGCYILLYKVRERIALPSTGCMRLPIRGCVLWTVGSQRTATRSANNSSTPTGRCTAI